MKESVKTDSILIGMKKEENTYKIEGKRVNQEEFEALIKDMTQVAGTYHCAKTTTGGRISYILLDKNGVEWIYGSAILEDKQYYTIRKKEY